MEKTPKHKKELFFKNPYLCQFLEFFRYYYFSYTPWNLPFFTSFWYSHKEYIGLGAAFPYSLTLLTFLYSHFSLLIFRIYHSNYLSPSCWFSFVSVWVGFWMLLVHFSIQFLFISAPEFLWGFFGGGFFCFDILILFI